MPTHQETMDALYASERRWECIRAGIIGELNTDCPLCQINDSCQTCAIGMYSGIGQCQDTAYYDYVYFSDFEGRVATEKAFDLSNEMLQYIRRVIKKWETWGGAELQNIQIMTPEQHKNLHTKGNRHE